MLYTSMPLERIYTNRVSSLIISRNPSSEATTTDTVKSALEYRSFDIEHGKIHARRDGDNYIVHSVNSTNMSDYLNDKYIPGTILSDM